VTLPEPLNPVGRDGLPAPLVPTPAETLDDGALQLAPVRIEGDRAIHFDPMDTPYFFESALSLLPDWGDEGMDLALSDPLGFITGEQMLLCRPDLAPASVLGGPFDRIMPFSVEFWYRFDGIEKEHYLFDCGVEGHEINNRVYLFFDGQALVFRVADVGMPTSSQESDDLIEHAQIRYDFHDLPLEKGVFYHIACAASGTKPSDLSLFVDGVPRGKRAFQTRLAQAMDPAPSSGPDSGPRLLSASIRVEDATTFPSRGVLRIGEELIEYTSRSEDQFIVEPSALDPFGGRKMRTSLGVEHPETHIAELYGYSSVLWSQQIPQGDHELKSDVGPFVVAEVNHAAAGGELTKPIYAKARTSPAYDNEILGKGFFTDTSAETLPLQGVGGGSLPEFGFSKNGGYAVVFTEFPVKSFSIEYDSKKNPSFPTITETYTIDVTDTGRPISPEEHWINGFSVFRYESFSGNALTQITWGSDSGYPQGFPLIFMEPEGAYLAGKGGQHHVLNFTKRRCFILEYSKDFEDVEFEDARVFVFPISVNINADGSDLAELFHPSYENPAEYNYRSELLQIGLEFQGENDTEWIRYDSIDKDIFCRDNLSDNEIQNLWNFLSPEGKINKMDPLKYDEVMNKVNRELAFRAQHGTGNVSHTALGSKALPVFEVTLNRLCKPGRHDAVTLVHYDAETDVESEPEGAVINYSNAYGPQPYSDRNRGGCALIALKSGVTGDYHRTVYAYAHLSDDLKGEDVSKELVQRFSVESRDYTRIVKFPSGELPSKEPETLVFGGDIVGDPSPSPGCLDEIRFRSYDTPHPDLPRFARFMLRVELQTSEEDQLYLETDALQYNRHVMENPLLEDFRILKSLPQDAGLLLVGDELIAYTDVDWEDGIITIAPNGRGMLNTEPGFHPAREPVRLLNFPELSIVENNLSPEDAVLLMKDSKTLPFEGALLIDEEVIGYSRNEADEGMLVMPEVFLTGQALGGVGLLRGRYGTVPARHLKGAVAYSLPVRYRDCFTALPDLDALDPRKEAEAALFDVPEAAYFPFSLHAPGAFFSQLTWVEEGQGPGAYLEVRARVGGIVDWLPLASVSKDQFSFNKVSGEGKSMALNRQGDRLDLRVHTRYVLGAFDPLDFMSNAWKYAPRLKALGVEYVQPTRIVRHEEWQ
jgi:hypothetical protein